jgi:hypothetical protein
MVLHEVGFNSQRDNENFNGKFSGWKQCFTTCAWMFMSFYTENIDVYDDIELARYFDDVEDSVGNPGIGEQVKRKYKWITGNTSYWWHVQKKGIEEWLWKNGVWGDMHYCEDNVFSNLYNVVKNGPMILGTKKLGGLKGGHIILVIGYNDDGDFIVNDPFGDANTLYKNWQGVNVVYPRDMLEDHTGKITRYMYWE